MAASCTGWLPVTWLASHKLPRSDLNACSIATLPVSAAQCAGLQQAASVRRLDHSKALGHWTTRGLPTCGLVTSRTRSTSASSCLLPWAIWNTASKWIRKRKQVGYSKTKAYIPTCYLAGVGVSDVPQEIQRVYTVYHLRYIYTWIGERMWLVISSASEVTI